LTTDSYTKDRRATTDTRARRIGPGFVMVLILSVASTAALLIAAVVYYLGAPARIASDYSSIASPANRVLSAELADYDNNRTHDLTAARSDLMSVVKTVSSVDDQLSAVTFPTAANNASGAVIEADKKLTKLIGLQAQAPTLRRMRSFDPGVQAAAAAVRRQVRAIRLDLGLPAASGPLF
jgi:hypothetical protein